MRIESTSDLDFELPERLIAQHPPKQRGESQLMILQAGNATPQGIETFSNSFLNQLNRDDLIVVNNSRVLKARIPVQRETGGRGELLLLHPEASTAEKSTWEAMARPARKYREEMLVATESGGAQIRFVERSSAQTWRVELPVSADTAADWLEATGQVPLPPYITPEDQDPERYQTVFARVPGSVAAPTASLHLDYVMWERLREEYEVAEVTLHVGAGTFAPVSSERLDDHVMHSESYSVTDTARDQIESALAEGRRIVACGTTAARVLESEWGNTAHQLGSGVTSIFITPGYKWGCVGALLTNFHLPKSTLLALVMAFHGIEETRLAYRHAIEQNMRFFSFGDAMFIHGPSVAS